MKFSCIVANLLLATSTCSAAERDTWFNDWPRGAIGHTIPASQITEVPHSLFAHAEELLNSQAALHIGEGYFAGFSYACPDGTSAYLVRALYEHPTTGTFSAQKSGNDLLVLHYALGAQSIAYRSALVVCLDFEPQNVYVGVGGAL